MERSEFTFLVPFSNDIMTDEEHRHPDWNVLHDLTSKCCACCNGTLKSLTLESLGVLKDVMSEETYKETLSEIDEFYAVPGNDKFIYHSRAMLEANYKLITRGACNLRYC